jgi:hypothetical protein
MFSADKSPMVFWDIHTPPYTAVGNKEFYFASDLQYCYTNLAVQFD